MAAKPGIPKGTRDFSPVEMAKRNYIFNTIRDVFHLFGYQQIETPSMENLSTLMGKYGDEGDKLLFEIQNSGDYFSGITDEELLSLVWNNLFSNALKFTEAHGTVSVALKTEGPYAAVRVADTGCGISPEVGKHIFEKFYQGDTSHAAQGNGLGLALVRRVVDIVGGDISVESEAGKGSAFTVKIRRAADEQAESAP